MQGHESQNVRFWLKSGKHYHLLLIVLGQYEQQDPDVHNGGVRKGMVNVCGGWC